VIALAELEVGAGIAVGAGFTVGAGFAVSPKPPRHPATKTTNSNVVNQISGLVIILNLFM
jgi:hypothetical protein